MTTPPDPPDPPPPDGSRPDDAAGSSHLRYAAWARELQARAPRPARRWWWAILAGVVGLGALIVVIAVLTPGSGEPAGPATLAPEQAPSSAATPPAAPPEASMSSESPRPTPEPESTGRPEPAEPARPAVTHTVHAGDTLAELAVRYGVPTEQLAEDNALADPDRILVGQTLRVGSPPAGVQVIAPGDTLSGLATQHHSSVSELMQLNPQIHDPDRIWAGQGIRLRP
jgi:LysM repeat protein